MKILIVSPYISTSKSLEYYQSQQINLAKELLALNLEVTIVTANRFNNTKKTVFTEGVRIDYLKTSKWFPEKEFNQPLLMGLWGTLKSKNFDIVQTSEFHALSTLIVSFFCFIFNKKMILYQGMYKDSDKSFKRILFSIWDFLFGKLICKVTNLAICKTSAAASYLKHKGIKQTKVIPVGVNTSFFNSNGLDKNKRNSKLKLLMIGSLIKRKNYITTIKALKIVKQKGYNFELSIIGKGKLEVSINDTIKFYNLENEINLIPEVPNTEMKHYYANSDFTMMFSYDEIFGMTILEAMACGCPFISNFEPGPNDIINLINGYKIRSDSEYQIAEGLISIFNKEELDRQLIEQTTNKNYSWYSIAQSYHKLYNKLIQT